MSQLHRLIIVLGDQLDRDSPLLRDLDRDHDLLWMAEVDDEAGLVWSHQARIALFLAAMRQFARDAADADLPLRYHHLGSAKALSAAVEGSRVTLAPASAGSSLHAELASIIQARQPQRLAVLKPGEWRVQHMLQTLAGKHDLPLEIVDDPHFYSTPAEFAAWAEGRKTTRLEYFYRELRRKHDVLMQEREPRGGRWNYDADNRGSFEASPRPPEPAAFRPDAITREVLALVAERFADHPGSLDRFDWPLTPAQAETALDDFIDQRLPRFGDVQDAMWTDQPWLYHSRLSAAMNLKLLNPRRVVNAAVDALDAGDARLNAVEGFVRQILGWREFVRGLYWLHMPGYAKDNALGAAADLPAWYWTGETDMNCLRQVIRQTLDTGYAHHIQRLMVTGLFALLYGVEPRQVHEWYLAVYVDAVEWVELPNTIGMSQFADGGRMGSKPYVASGKYLKRMSNYCAGCRYRPDRKTGPEACPFTTFYWDFLLRHEARFAGHPRMKMQLRNLARLSDAERAALRDWATQLRERLGSIDIDR